jgi:hypothetical protein
LPSVIPPLYCKDFVSPSKVVKVLGRPLGRDPVNWRPAPEVLPLMSTNMPATTAFTLLAGIAKFKLPDGSSVIKLPSMEPSTEDTRTLGAPGCET